MQDRHRREETHIERTAVCELCSENDKTFVHGVLQINDTGIKVAPSAGAGSGAATPAVTTKDPYSSLSHKHGAGGDIKIAAAPNAAAAASASYSKSAAASTAAGGSGGAAPSASDAGAGAGAAAEGKYGALRLEQLQMLEKLGEGNSSSVYRALHVPSGQLMAVKQIQIHDRDKRHQIMKEVLTLYQCESKYLISFYGAFFKVWLNPLSLTSVGAWRVGGI